MRSDCTTKFLCAPEVKVLIHLLVLVNYYLSSIIRSVMTKKSENPPMHENVFKLKVMSCFVPQALQDPKMLDVTLDELNPENGHQ